MANPHCTWMILASLLLMAATPALAQQKTPAQTAAKDDNTPANVLSPAEWKRVDAAVNRALTWLAAHQEWDGSFPTINNGQPGVTSLCAMAFMAHGHLGGEGKYGKQLQLSTEYAVRCQKPNGLVTLVGPEGPKISRQVEHEIGATAAYNHAISTLMLSEVYGSTKGERSAPLKKAISQALAATLEMQRWPKEREIDRGGWRYRRL